MAFDAKRLALAGLVFVLFAVALCFAISARGGTFVYRDTFKFDNNGDGTAEERHGATVRAYPLNSPTAYTSTTTDTTLSGHNFALALSDEYSYYTVEFTNYSTRHYNERTTVQVNTRNFTVASGESLTVSGQLSAASANITAGTLGTATVTTLTAGSATADSVLTLTPRIAGLQSTTRRPTAGYMIPRGGVLSLRLDDYNTGCYALIDSLEAHGLRASLLAVTGLGGTAWQYGTGDAVTRSDYLRWRRDMAMGHEVVDHSTYHDVTTGGATNGGWDRGKSPSVYAAKMDSAKTSFASYLGQAAQLFVWPGGTKQVYFSDTTLTGYKGRHRFGVTANVYPVTPLSKWTYFQPGLHNESKDRRSHHPTNIPGRNMESATMTQNKFALAQAFVRHGWQTIFCHCGTDSVRDKFLRLALWADSLGIPVLPMTEAAELYYYGDFDTYHNLFLPDPFSWDLDGNGVCDYFTSGTMNATSYPGKWLTVPDYTTPCGTKTAALVVLNGDAYHESIYVGGIRAGSYYEGKLWVKSHEVAGDLPDTLTIGFAQYDSQGNLRYNPYTTTVLSDTSWTEVAPASWTYIPPDTIANSGPPPLGGAPTEYLGFFFFNSSAYVSADGDTFMVACPLIREKEEVGVTP